MRRVLVPLVGLTIALAVWAAANQPAPPSAEVARLAEGLEFRQHSLPRAPTNQEVRRVQPGLQGIDAWISSVGASIGAVDLRGAGHAGDACLTDPRDDQVRVFSVPGSSGKPFKTFELSPTGLRYDDTMAPIGCVPTDINQDGAQDILVYYWGRTPVLFINGAKPGEHSPRVQDFTAHELVTPMQVWNTTALNVADVDGDGVLDIFVGNYFPDGAKVLDPRASGDRRMQMQHSLGKARNAGANRLFLGHAVSSFGEVPSFEDVSTALPTDSANSWTLASGFQDLTDDGLPEIYVANDFGPDQLLVNDSRPGHVSLREVTGRRDLTSRRSTVLGHDSFKGMGVAFSYKAGADLPEIFVSNITSPWALQESNFAFVPTGSPKDLAQGRLPYRDRSSSLGLAHSGWSWDIKTVDFQNRGEDDLVQATGFVQGDRNVWPRLQEMAMGNDLVISHPLAWLHVKLGDDLSGHEANLLWRRSGNRYVDIGSHVPFGSDEVSRGLATADVNGDGRYDVLVANQWQDSRVLINGSDTGSSQFVVVNALKATPWATRTPLVGATVRLHTEGYSRTAQVYPANGHSGVRDAAVHFGIPDQYANQPLTATITWRDGDGLHHQDVPIHHGYQDLEVAP